MFVIFLDIDGVLNHRTRTPFGDNPPPRSQMRGPYGIPLDPDNVAAFRRYVAAVDGQVVVHSSWRGYCHDEDANPTIAATLAEVGITVHDFTPDMPREKDLSIRAWLAAHPEVTAWVVVDDQRVMQPQIQPDEMAGFVDSDWRLS